MRSATRGEARMTRGIQMLVTDTLKRTFFSKQISVEKKLESGW